MPQEMWIWMCLYSDMQYPRRETEALGVGLVPGSWPLFWGWGWKGESLMSFMLWMETCQNQSNSRSWRQVGSDCGWDFSTMEKASS